MQIMCTDQLVWPSCQQRLVIKTYQNIFIIFVNVLKVFNNQACQKWNFCSYLLVAHCT